MKDAYPRAHSQLRMCSPFTNAPILASNFLQHKPHDCLIEIVESLHVDYRTRSYVYTVPRRRLHLEVSNEPNIVHARTKHHSPHTHKHQASTSHLPGLKAHQCGCNAIALTPLFTSLYLSSCSLGRASDTFLALPLGSFAPVQKTSAELAARGHTVESRFSGEDCSVHRSCCPV